MSQIQVDNIYNKEATGSPSFPLGANVTGVITATTFKGGAEITSGSISGASVSATSVSATTGTFTSNVSIGGTLTYEDVTNIDSVGLITARQGIKVIAGGINAVGVVTATSFDGSGANLTNLPSGELTGALPAISGANLTGIEASPTVSLVADGAIAANKACIIKTNGKAEQVASVITPVDPVSITGIAAGTPHVNDGTSKNRPHNLLYDPYSGTYMYTGTHTSTGYYNLFWGKATATNVSPERGSGSSGRWPEVGITGGGSGYIGGVSDMGQASRQISITNNNGWVAWLVQQSSTNDLYVIIGKTTENTIGVQADHPNYCHEVTTATAASLQASLHYVGDNQIAVIYQNDNSGSGYIRVGTVSGVGANASTITWGSETEIAVGALGMHGAAACDIANKKIMFLTRGGGSAGNDSRTNSVVITVSTDNSVSVGTWDEGNMGDGYFYDPTMVFDPDTNRFVCAFTNADGSGDGVLKIGSISGTTPSWGANVEFSASSSYGDTSQIAMCYHPDIKMIMLGYREDTDIKVKLVSISNSSNTCTPSSDRTTITGAATDTCIVYDTKWKFPTMGYTHGTTSMYVQAFDAGGVTTNATNVNYIGFSKAAYADGANATIQVIGSENAGQSGMTVAVDQYLQLDGSLATTPPTGSSIVAGKSLSASRLLIKG